MSDFAVLIAPPLPSPARVEAPVRSRLRVGAVQTSWHADPVEHADALARGVRLAAGNGARLICLQELTLSPYFAAGADRAADAASFAETIPDGPTTSFAAAMARDTGAFVHASLFERVAGDRGFNTAICVAPDGRLLARTRKMHIPRSLGYHEDVYFRPGDSGFPVYELEGARFAFPTCWDQWFPELARCYSLRGADVIVYPTAIGSEPHLPAFDTQPLWEQTIRANGLANATFMVAVNRIGREEPLTFYGSSFISDPYGRVLVQAPRDRDAVIVAELDLDQRRDWLSFGLLSTRRPGQYAPLVEGPE